MNALDCQIQDSIAVVRLDRPPANALNHESCDELHGILERLRRDDVSAVVLTGAGRFFSAGLDLFEVFEYPEARGRAFANAFDDAIAGWFSLDKPVVAAVNGHAIAGGAVLAATADFRLIADGGAKSGLTEIQVGVPFPTSALEVIRFSCGGPRLTELLYRGRTYPPAEAVAARLADELVPAAELIDRALALAAELGSRRSDAYALPKRALRAEHVARITAARASGLDPIWERWRSPDLRAAMEAFRGNAVGKR